MLECGEQAIEADGGSGCRNLRAREPADQAVVPSAGIDASEAFRAFDGGFEDCACVVAEAACDAEIDHMLIPRDPHQLEEALDLSEISDPYESDLTAFEDLFQTVQKRAAACHEEHELLNDRQLAVVQRQRRRVVFVVGRAREHGADAGVLLPRTVFGWDHLDPTDLLVLVENAEKEKRTLDLLTALVVDHGSVDAEDFREAIEDLSRTPPHHEIMRGEVTHGIDHHGDDLCVGEDACDPHDIGVELVELVVAPAAGGFGAEHRTVTPATPWENDVGDVGRDVACERDRLVEAHGDALPIVVFALAALAVRIGVPELSGCLGFSDEDFATLEQRCLELHESVALVDILNEHGEDAPLRSGLWAIVVEPTELGRTDKSRHDSLWVVNVRSNLGGIALSCQSCFSDIKYYLCFILLLVRA